MKDNDLTNNSLINKNYKILTDQERQLFTKQQAQEMHNFDRRTAYSDNNFNQRYRNALQPISPKQQQWEAEYRRSCLPDNIDQVLLEYGIVGELAVIAKMLYNDREYRDIAKAIRREHTYVFRQVKRIRRIMGDMV